MINPKSVALVLFAVAFGFAGLNAQADPGDSVYIPDATFVDNRSGDTYKFTIKADEYPTEAGVGTVFLELKGPRLSLITVGKGWNPPQPPPPQPLAAITANNLAHPAGHQAVDIGDRVVEVSAHAFVHSDAPNIVFIGPVTVDVRIEDTAGKILVEIYSPKGKDKLQGKITN